MRPASCEARICPHLPYSARSRVAVSCAPFGGNRLRRPGAAPPRERKGGFQVNARHTIKGNRRPATDRGGAAPPAPDGTALSRPANAPPSVRLERPEFPKNSINIDKFTGFFDKFPKNYFLVTGCNQRNSRLNPSPWHSDTAAKKVFRRPRISPHLPRGATRRRSPR